MAGRPKEGRLKAKLAEIAKREMGPGATGLDWTVQQVADGVTIGKIAELLAEEMGESVSRSFFSWHINNVTTDAKERIKAARKEATHVWAEQALDIAERPATTTADVQQARLQIETRRWLAGDLQPRRILREAAARGHAGPGAAASGGPSGSSCRSRAAPATSCRDRFRECGSRAGLGRMSRAAA